MGFKSKIKYNKHDNDYGFDKDIFYKQNEGAIWAEGKSNLLRKFYTNTLMTLPLPTQDYFINKQTYFWKQIVFEPQSKAVHSGLPNAIIKTLINIVGKPEIKVNKKELNKETKQYEIVEDEELTKLLEEILEENNFYTLLNKDQQFYMLAVGDGAFFINFNKEISDYPIIEFSDGRNVEFEYVGNRIVAVLRRQYFKDFETKKTYMLLTRLGTELAIDNRTKQHERVATVEYYLYETETEQGKVVKEVSLNTIKETQGLKNIVLRNVDKMIAEPTIYEIDKNSKRGKPFFESKFDLLDDLDQNLSMSSTTTRRSAPVDYLPEELMEYDNEGKPKKFNTFERKVLVYKNDLNSATGVNQAMIETKQPILNFEQYSTQALEILHNILSGLVSPATLGIDLARDDNAAAQREKEKVTIITRDNIIDFQTGVIQRLLNKVLKVYFSAIGDYEKARENYEIYVNYPEYANPSFDSKLAVLGQAYVSGAMSEKQYVNELWGESLTEEEKEEEIARLKEMKNSFVAPSDNEFDPFNL